MLNICKHTQQQTQNYPSEFLKQRKEWRTLGYGRQTQNRPKPFEAAVLDVVLL